MSFQLAKLSRRLDLLSSTWPVPQLSRPVTLFFLPFVGCQPKHDEKYLRFYEQHYRRTERPLNVVLLRGRPLDFASAVKGIYTVSGSRMMLREALDPAKDHLLIHGISIGCFLHAIQLKKDEPSENPMHTHLPFYKDLIVGQVFDSPIYVGSAKEGLPIMVEALLKSTVSPVFRSPLSAVINGYYSMSPTFLEFMDSYIDAFIHRPARVPTLNFFSDADEFIDADRFARIATYWKNDMGMDVESVQFLDSPHAKHAVTCPEVYEEKMLEYLVKVDAEIERREKSREKEVKEEEEEEVKFADTG